MYFIVDRVKFMDISFYFDGYYRIVHQNEDAFGISQEKFLTKEEATKRHFSKTPVPYDNLFSLGIVPNSFNYPNSAS